MEDVVKKVGKVLEGEISRGICPVGKWRSCGPHHHVAQGSKRQGSRGNRMSLAGSNNKKSWIPKVSRATGGIQSKYSSHAEHLYERARE